MGRAVGRTSSTGVPVQHREHRSRAIPRPQQVFASALLRHVSLLSRLATITFALHSSPTLFDWPEVSTDHAARRRCQRRSLERFSCQHQSFSSCSTRDRKKKAVGIQKISVSRSAEAVGSLLLTKKKLTPGSSTVASWQAGAAAVVQTPSAG